MFRCPYCECLFPKLPDWGGCPRCAAPNVEKVPEDPIRTDYVFVSLPNRPAYYAPPRSPNPIRRAKVWAFETFGFYITVLAGVILFSFLTWMAYNAYLVYGTATPSDGPTIPTPLPTKAFVEPTREFSQYEFYSARESENLRTEENSIQVAVLGAGYGARYMTEYGVVLDRSTWEQVDQAFGISGFQPDDTTFTIQVNDLLYNLNKHQGFILANYPDRIFIVDENGKIWESNFSDQVLVSLQEAQSALAKTLPPNPRLSLTLK